MKTAELVKTLTDKPFTAKVIEGPILTESKPDGTKLYTITLLEVKDDVGIARNVRFYVVDEGKVTERAVWKDAVPTETISDKAAGRPVVAEPVV